MNIAVINGSPKGENSITFHTYLYLQKKFPRHEYTVIHAGKYIRKCEEDFSECLEILKQAELIVFVYPVYTFIAPSQLHRFIELMKDQGDAFQGKYVTQITTSKHFYDVTAHRFVTDNCLDMGMKVLKGLSADMDDLLSKKGRFQAGTFFNMCLWKIKNKISDYKPQNTVDFKPVSLPKKPVSQVSEGPLFGKSVIIVADIYDDDKTLSTMIERFRRKLPIKSRLINIKDFPFSGGCLGCFNCAVSGKCIYKDGFDSFLREEIQSGSAIIYAFKIKDHSMGSLFKTYDDRQFCNGHRTVTMGSPVGYIISGKLSEEENLRMIIEARAEVGGNFLAGVATDEFNTNEDIDNLAKTLVYSLERRISMPANFLGVGGMKIFRDLIFEMQGMMRADHEFFKSHGQYDFPQKKMGRIMGMYAVGSMLSSEKIRKKIGNKMTEGMIAPYKNVLKK